MKFLKNLQLNSRMDSWLFQHGNVRAHNIHTTGMINSLTECADMIDFGEYGDI